MISVSLLRGAGGALGLAAALLAAPALATTYHPQALLALVP